MKSRKKKPQKKPIETKRCRAIVPIDGAAVRSKAKKAYEKTRRDLDRARLELDRFQTMDQPEFQKWINRTFGPLLTEVRETNQKLEEKRQLIFEIESESYALGISFQQAYRRVMDRRENPVKPAPEPNSEFGGSRPSEEQGYGESGPGSDEAFEAEWSELEDDFESFFEEAFGIPRSGSRHRRHPETAPNKDPAALRVKTLYRSVVRRLHPDVQSEMSSQKMEWWHQAQAAYEKNDAEQLEMILNLCEIEDLGTTSQTSVSILIRITNQFRSTLRSIKREISKFRRDPAWNFSINPNPERLKSKIESDLREELFNVQCVLESIESQIAEWAIPPRTRKKQARRQPITRNHPEFLF